MARSRADQVSRSDTPVASLKNLGPASASWLEAAGFHTRDDLEQVGSVMAYKIVKHRFPEANLNLLYALEAALRGVHWNALPPETKEQLRRDAAEPLIVGT